MRKVLVALFVIALVALAPAQALAAGWTSYGKDAQHTSNANESLALPLKATSVINTNYEVIGTPLIAGDTVYYTDGYIDDAGSYGELVAVYRDTGKVKWVFQSGGSVEDTPALANDSLVFGSYDGCVYRVSATDGLLIWKSPVGDGMYSSPLIYGDLVYVGTDGSNFYALDLATGKVAWKLEDNTTQASPAGDRGKVFIGTYDGHVYALDAPTGHVVWSYDTASAIHASPLIFDGKVFIATRGGHLYAFDEDTGTLLWKANLGYKADATPSADPEGGLVIIGTYGGYVKAFYAANGTMKWTSGYYGPIYSTATVAGDTVYSATQDGWLFALNKTDGSGTWGIDVGGVTFSSPAVADGYLVIATLSRQVIVFRSATAVSEASPSPALPGYIVPSEPSSGSQASATASQAPFPGAMAAIGALVLGIVLYWRR